MSHPDPIDEWRNPLGYEERYAGVPPVPGKLWRSSHRPSCGLT